MKKLKAVNPVNAGKTSMPFNTVHKRAYVESTQDDGTQSKLILTINETYLDEIWLGVWVDGKFYDLSFVTADIFNELKRLTDRTNPLPCMEE